MAADPDPNPGDLSEAWLVFTTGIPSDQLHPRSRDAADAAVRAGVARWAIVGGHWRLRWNYPEPPA